MSLGKCSLVDEWSLLEFFDEWVIDPSSGRFSTPYMFHEEFMIWLRRLFPVLFAMLVLSGCAAKMAYKRGLGGRCKVKCIAPVRNSSLRKPQTRESW